MSLASERSIFDLMDSSRYSEADPKDLECFSKIFKVREHPGTLVVSEELAEKYGGLAGERRQRVLSVTNVVITQQTLFNEERTKKPQTFFDTGVGLDDPTSGGGAACDFCQWETLTAEDEWGRVETANVVTASNLFKAHGLHGCLLFKHHDPLQFTSEQVSQLLSAADEWLQQAHAVRPDAQHPLLLWNCLPRAGASQFHGHAQIMLSSVDFPEFERLRHGALEYASSGSKSHVDPEAAVAQYYRDVARAHRAVGLLREFGTEGDKVQCYANMSPLKDMEVVLIGRHLTSSAFATALHNILRCLIDDRGVRTFNVGISGMALGSGQAREGSQAAQIAAPVVARIVSRGSLKSRASDFGALELFGGSSIGHSDPYRVMASLDDFMGKKG
ncbi:hypothetical protein CYMTET_49980 [Cymbomonas tetramitiformis]|uniref:Uncharacterized protein n=1 Tax=Cymbomonas tetramitiformis TaxID=36881 RepID=A0AAE0BR22_9CHLO|nr:hypothetical protein CYMTET_49980 [Cymbomonas tetramitiformis]